ncbi:hypothetical protein, partial [Butyricicoccus sp.]|uniref:hypothetical protein n=1 Tax=Butyricicoccus sp. TaxID=2049021 RepID=UPI0037365CD3
FYVIPSPWALAVTGVRPAQLLDPALPTFFELAQQIGALIKRWSPAIWTGFNSVRFDEEMLRQAFYQNLQPDIFATQFNGNTRFDVLTALYAVWYRQPDLFEWPVEVDGRLRFNLDRIAPLNGFAAHDAHDALGDVEATIHIARRIDNQDMVLTTRHLCRCHFIRSAAFAHTDEHCDCDDRDNHDRAAQHRNFPVSFSSCCHWFSSLFQRAIFMRSPLHYSFYYTIDCT